MRPLPHVPARMPGQRRHSEVDDRSKATYVRTNGLPFHDRLLVRIDSLAALAGRLPGLANWALDQPAEPAG